jgi:drug/metabolite transporter (DMT)-like permease
LSTRSDAIAGSGIVTTGRAFWLLSVVVVLWGANWPIMKIGLESISPLWFGGLRMASGAAVLFALLAVLGRLRLPPRHDWPVVLSVSLLHMTLTTALMYIGLTYVDAGRAALLSYTTPLWIAPLAVPLLGETLGWRKVMGVAVGMSGLAVLFNPLSFDWNDPDTVIGNGILTISAMVWALAILHVRKHKWHGTPLDLAPWQMAIAGVLLCGGALVMEDAGAIQWSGWLGANLAYNGVVASAFCFWAMLTVMRSLPAVTTSTASLAIPVSGVLFSALTLGETLTPTLLGGLALILAGVALVSLPKRLRAS